MQFATEIFAAAGGHLCGHLAIIYQAELVLQTLQTCIERTHI